MAVDQEWNPGKGICTILGRTGSKYQSEIHSGLAELLVMLESEGVQIFVSTHDYFLSKYIEVKRNENSVVQYISLYKDEESKVQCETAEKFEY